MANHFFNSGKGKVNQFSTNVTVRELNPHKCELYQINQKAKSKEVFDTKAVCVAYPLMTVYQSKGQLYL